MSPETAAILVTVALLIGYALGDYRRWSRTEAQLERLYDDLDYAVDECDRLHETIDRLHELVRVGRDVRTANLHVNITADTSALERELARLRRDYLGGAA